MKRLRLRGMIKTEYYCVIRFKIALVAQVHQLKCYFEFMEYMLSMEEATDPP